MSYCRYWRIWQIHIHQTDANYSRQWLFRWRQTGIHKTSLSKYIHGNAVDDTRHGYFKNTIYCQQQCGKCTYTLYFCWADWDISFDVLIVVYRFFFVGKFGIGKKRGFRNSHCLWTSVCSSHQRSLGWWRHTRMLRSEAWISTNRFSQIVSILDSYYQYIIIITHTFSNTTLIICIFFFFILIKIQILFLWGRIWAKVNFYYFKRFIFVWFTSSYF